MNWGILSKTMKHEPMDAAAREILKEQVQAALSVLSDRERQVLSFALG